MPALAWVGGPLPSTADGASWALIGKQLGWSLLAQTAGVLCCGARPAARSRDAPAPRLRAPAFKADSRVAAALLRGPWKRAAPRTLFKTMHVSQQARQCALRTPRATA